MACSVCGCESRFIAKTESGFDLLRCGTCELVFCSPMPTTAELDAYYQGFAYAKPAESELARQVAYTEAGVSRLVHEITGLAMRPIQKVLDYGGGLGFFAHALSQHYSDVALFDLDGHAREFARERFPSRFRVIDQAEQALAEKYDLILLNQVIEHVPEPVGFLQSFAQALKPDGVLLVTTPNNDAIDTFLRPDVLWHYARRLKGPTSKAISLLLSDSWVCCDPPRHLYAFNRNNLVTVGKHAGFEDRRTSTAFFDEDALGQPKYSFSGFKTPRALVETVLYLWSKLSAPVARALDPQKQKGSTLFVWFAVPGGDQSAAATNLT